MALTMVFLVTTVVIVCMLKCLRGGGGSVRSVDIGNDGSEGDEFELPRVTLQVASIRRQCKDMGDPLVCKHINENGSMCNVMPAPSGDTYSRQSKGRWHGCKLVVHAQTCRRSCSKCHRLFSRPPKDAVLHSIADEFS